MRLSADVFAHFVRVDPPAGLDTEDRCFDILPGGTRDIVLRGDLAGLDAVRIRNEQLGGRQPVRGNFASAAGTPQEKKKKVEVRCSIACDASSGLQKKK